MTYEAPNRPRSAITFVALLVLASCQAACISPRIDAEVGNNAQPQFVTFDQLLHIHFTLEYPIAQVWPYVIGIESWIKANPIESIAGVRGETGEIIKISVLTNDNKKHEYFAEVIQVLPRQKLVMKYLPVKSTSGVIEGLYGYDVYELEEINGITQVSFQTYQEYGTSKMSGEEFRAIMELGMEASEKRWLEEYIPTLRALLRTDLN